MRLRDALKVLAYYAETDCETVPYDELRDLGERVGKWLDSLPEDVDDATVERILIATENLPVLTSGR